MSFKVGEGINESFKDLTTDSSSTNWILWEIDGKGKDAVLRLNPDGDKGSGGLTELRGKLDASKVYYGAFLVTGVDNRENTESKRSKYVNFTFVGDSVPVMKRSAVSVQRTEVFKLMQGIAASMDFSTPEDLDKDSIAKKLLASGGAHKPTRYEFGDGTQVDITDFHQKL